MLFATLTGLLAPWPIAWILDYILEGESLPAALGFLEDWSDGDPLALLGPAAIAVVAIALADAVVAYVHRYYEQLASASLMADIRARVFQQLQSVSLSFQESWQSGDVVLRMTSDAQDLKRLLVDIPLRWIQWLLLISSITAVLAWNDWRLAGLAWAIVPILYLFTWRFGSGVNKAAKKKKRKESQVASLVAENVRAMALVQAYGREDEEQLRFGEENTAAKIAEMRSVQLSKSFKRVADVLIAIGTALVLYMASTLVLEGVLSVGLLVVFYRYLKKLYRPVEKLALSVVELAKLQASCARILELVDADLVVHEVKDAQPAPRFEGRVEFRNVRFGYGGGPDVLRDLSFEVEPGETVALVGPSGAGKSTLARLLLRFYDPREGSIRIDGHDLREFTLHSLRDRIAILFQEPMLLRRSIAENIAYGRPGAGQPDVENAARLAQAHDFIEELPEGYDTALVDQGENLSGGQRQRIAIARAILRDAPLVILDEPYRGLDAHAEAAVVEALAQLTAQRTTFVIAHRFATLRHADHVLVLDPGSPAELGTHDSLLESSPSYRGLYDLQVASSGAQPDRAAVGS
jgi:ABC-type multidrug transport system fused ATPase/permease subunit